MKRMDAVIYIHGKGGTAAEAEHYKHLFPACDLIGIAYKGSAPRDAGKEIHDARSYVCYQLPHGHNDRKRDTV